MASKVVLITGGTA